MVAHDGSDVFEAREAIEVPYSERFGDAGDQLGGYDRFDDVFFASEPSQLAPALDDVIDQQRTGLVAVQQHVLTVLVPERHADAVGIGVGRQHDFGLFALGQLDRHFHGRAFLRIRGLDCRKIAVRDILFLDGQDVRKTVFP